MLEFIQSIVQVEKSTLREGQSLSQSGLRQKWPLSPFTSHSRPQICQPEPDTRLKAASNNTQASLACAPTKVHLGLSQSPANYLQDGQRAFSPDLLLRPQDGQKFASVSTASKNHGKTWGAEIVDRWCRRGRRVTRPRGSLRDLGSRGLDPHIETLNPISNSMQNKENNFRNCKVTQTL